MPRTLSGSESEWICSCSRILMTSRGAMTKLWSLVSRGHGAGLLGVSVRTATQGLRQRRPPLPVAESPRTAVSLRHASDDTGAYLMLELCDTLRHAPSSSMAEVAHTCRERDAICRRGMDSGRFRRKGTILGVRGREGTRASVVGRNCCVRRLKYPHRDPQVPGSTQVPRASCH